MCFHDLPRGGMSVPPRLFRYENGICSPVSSCTSARRGIPIRALLFRSAHSRMPTGSADRTTNFPTTSTRIRGETGGSTSRDGLAGGNLRESRWCLDAGRSTVSRERPPGGHPPGKKTNGPGTYAGHVYTPSVRGIEPGGTLGPRTFQTRTTDARTHEKRGRKTNPVPPTAGPGSGSLPKTVGPTGPGSCLGGQAVRDPPSSQSGRDPFS
mmetsp:Transcript_10964/g.28755  ORF Transcript_10964/g.28755 Transcript_10964/m.28755 type:complete len:210 (+) Transcript_10964:74-703(+)